MAVEVKARLSLDTSDFRKGSAEVDRLGDQMLQKERRRGAQYDEAATARVRNGAAASEQAAAREQQQAERAARRSAEREANEAALARRREEREKASAEKAAQRSAEAEAREAAVIRRREERNQAEAQKAATRATQQAAAAQRTAEQASAKESRAATQRAGQLQLQLNDIFTGLGSGQSPLTVAIQQGPQIAQIYGGWGNVLSSIPRLAMGAVAAVGALVAVMAVGISSASASAQRQRQYAIELQATGNIASVTAGQLEDLANAEARRPGADRAGTATTLGTFAGNARLQSESELARALGSARDLARVTGQELPAAATDLNQSLDGTAAGARKLDQAYNLLTASEAEQIRLLDEQGRKHEVVNIVLAATERRFKGLNEQGLSPTSKALNDLGNAWTSFADKVGRSPITQGLMSGGAHVLNGAAMLLGGPPAAATATNGPTAQDIAQARESLRLAEESAARIRAQRDDAHPAARGYAQAELDKAEKRVADLRANVDYLRSQTVGLVEQQQAAQATSVQGEVERRNKELQDLVARSSTIEAQRRMLTAERARLQEGIRDGAFSPESLKEAREHVQRLDGQLASLSTTSEKLQRDLDFETRLAKLPPHFAQLERAWQQMYRSALEAGDAEATARAKADQAKANALGQASTATQQQIALLGAEARAALDVAAAYGQSRAAGLRTAATASARAAEEQGQIAPGTAGAVAQETLEKNAAATVAAAAEKNRAYAEELDGLQRVTAAEGVSAEAAREAERVNRVAALATELRAQAAASGSAAIAAAAEREIAAYDRLSRQQLELDRARAAQQLNAQFDPDVAHAQQMAQLADLEATGRLTARTVAEATRQAEQQRLDASRSATDGMIAGLRRYADEATNAGRASADGIATGMRAAEDAVANFVVRGSFNFNAFVNSALADAARLATRQAITGPLASAASSALGSLSSWLFGGGGTNAATSGTGAGVTPPSASTGYMHGGGIVGRDRSRSEFLPASLWDRAPRHHTGGVVLGPDEIPIVAKRREEVLTESDPRHVDNLGRGFGGGGVGLRLDVTVVNSANANVRAEKGIGADGMPNLKIFVDQVEQDLAGKFMNTRGPLYKAVTGTLGAKQVARP